MHQLSFESKCSTSLVYCDSPLFWNILCAK